MKKWMSLLLAALLLLTVCACTPSKRTEEKVRNYLQEKYGDLQFEMISYARDSETSGRYIINAKCVDTDVTFQIYASTMMITDSYEIEFANSVMEKKLSAIINDVNHVMHVEDILWLNLYSEQASGYKFREPDELLSYDTASVKDIYRILLSDEIKTEADAATSIYNVVVKLYLGGVTLDHVTFRMTLDGKTLLLNTDTMAIKNTTREKLTSVLKDAEKQSAQEKDLVFYKTASEYSIDFYSESQE